MIPRESGPRRRLNLTGAESHELAKLVMQAITEVSQARDDPSRLRMLRSLLERLTS